MREHGVLLLDVTAPTVLVSFATPQLRPAGIVVTALFDYTDYDLQAPSVAFVDTFTGERLKLEQMYTQMVRGIPQSLPIAAGPPGVGGSPMQPSVLVPQPLIQQHDGGWPFLCLPGVREYHSHPGHSGDPWELHRTTGAGGLVRLVETIRKYAIEPIPDWAVQLVTRVGFQQGPPPE